ncbi:MAG: hypothetical protein R3B54_02455 [Bdellovibrionota bacterium]
MTRLSHILLLFICWSYAPAWAVEEPTKLHDTARGVGEAQDTGTGTSPSTKGDEDTQKDEDPKEKLRRRAKDLANKLVNAEALKSGEGKSAEERSKAANEDSDNMGDFIGEVKGEDGKFDEEFATAADEVLTEIQTDLQTRLDSLPPGPSPERTELQAQLGRVAALQGFITNNAPPGSALARGPSGGTGSTVATGTTPAGTSTNSNGSTLDIAGKSGGTSDPGKGTGNSQVAANQSSTSQPLKSLPLPSTASTTSTTSTTTTPQASQPAVAQSPPQSTKNAQPTKKPVATPPTIYTAAVDKATQAIKALETSFFGPKDSVKSETPKTEVASAPKTKEGVVTARESTKQRPTAEPPKAFTPPALKTVVASVSPSTANSNGTGGSSTAFTGDETFDFNKIESSPPAPIVAAGARPYAPEAPRGVTTIEQEFFEPTATTSLNSKPVVEVASTPEATENSDVVSLRTVASSRGALREFASEMKKGLDNLKERLTQESEPEPETTSISDARPVTPAKPSTSSATLETQMASTPSTAEAKPGGSVLQFMNLMKQKAQENPV